MSFLIVQELSAGYGKETVLEKLSFSLEAGELLGVIGANGCGKTTLLKAICGILPHEGVCTLDGTVLEEVPAKTIAKLASYIPQRSGISIDISALDVVLMGFNPRLGLLEQPSKAMRDIALQTLRQVGLEGKEECNYLHLSEGQKQLCILARTLVAGSRLLLLDEPESALDFRFRHEMLWLLRAWVKEQNRSAVVTLHDPSLALNFCHKLLLLDGGKVLGILQPQKDTLEDMEQLLSKVYGSVSLQRCQNRKGETQLIMLKEENL